MKLKDFIETYSHNNELWIENKNCMGIQFRYNPQESYFWEVIMDWEMKFTDIADCEVSKIANVYHSTQGITIRLDTDRVKFDFIPELVREDNCPVWLYEKVHNIKLQVRGAN